MVRNTMGRSVRGDDAGVSVVGRDAEAARIESLLAHAAGPLRGIALEGEPGIGKTALWRLGVARAGELGLRVLAARPTEAERGLALAALVDLVTPLAGEIGALPAPQRRALRVALMLKPACGRPPAALGIAIAVLALLRRVADQQPVVVAVDDEQWVDAESRAALAYALRRIESNVVVLATRRSELVEPENALEPQVAGVERLRVGPLDRRALREVVRAELGVPPPSPLLARLHEVSGGNPFFALEIARAIQRSGGFALTGHGTLPVPENLRALVDERLATLGARRPAPDRSRLPRRPDTRNACRRRLRRRGDRARRPRGHPRPGGGTGPLRAPAARLGRARRGARFACAPSSRPAGEDRGRPRAPRPPPRARGDRALGTGLRGARAGRARSPGERRSRRRRGARRAGGLPLRAAARRGAGAARARGGTFHFEAGRPLRARVLLDGLLDGRSTGRARAAALALLAETQVGGTPAMAEHCRRALAERGVDARLRARILHTLAFAELLQGHFRIALGHAREAAGLLEPLDDTALRTLVEARVGWLEAIVEAAPRDRLVRAIGLEESVPGGVNLYESPRTWLGVALTWADELDEARVLLEGQYTRALEEGDESRRVSLCYHLGELEVRAGRWQARSEISEEGFADAEASGVARRRGALLFPRALAAAHLGRIEEARAWATEGLAIAEAERELVFEAQHRQTLGFVALSAGDPAEAVRLLEGLVARTEEVPDPGTFIYHGDLIEALVELGRLDDAGRVLAGFEERALPFERPRAVALAARSRALLAVARRQDGADELAERALAAHAGWDAPFERARTLLVLGRACRLAGDRRGARTVLEEAVGELRRLGAPLWAGRADRELRRLGGRAAAGPGLTPPEHEIARLVMLGRSNQDVADALYLSRKTVEWNLSKIYRKLGVRSRAELAAVLRRDEQRVAASAD